MLVNMNDILLKAQEEKYAVGFFNAVNIDMAKAVIETAEEMHSPIMIGTAEVLLPAMGLNYVADYLIPMAKAASVPVCVHYDHGLTFDKCMEALDLGFTSIMYDCSTADYESNLKNLAEMVKICHERNVTVEGELGHVGDNEGAGKLDNPSDYYTDPVRAEDYVKRTRVDSLAVAVGNAHGDYKFPPKLDFERIEALKTSAVVPLSLHGGSGLSDLDIKTAINKGICKINIFTDLDKAGKVGIDEALKNGAKTLMQIMPYELTAMKQVVREKISLFGSENKV